MAKTYAFANQKFCYIQIVLNIEKYVEQDYEHSKEWLVYTDPNDWQNS